MNVQVCNIDERKKLQNVELFSFLCTDTKAFVYIFFLCYAQFFFGTPVFLIVHRLNRFLRCRSSLLIPSQLFTTTRLRFRRYILP